MDREIGEQNKSTTYNPSSSETIHLLHSLKLSHYHPYQFHLQSNHTNNKI